MGLTVRMGRASGRIEAVVGVGGSPHPMDSPPRMYDWSPHSQQEESRSPPADGPALPMPLRHC